jgi:hypothetical protein
MTKKKCYNCKLRSHAFKVGNLTHYHCDAPTYQQQRSEGKEVSPWETLREFSNTCKEHEKR